jgi:WD40 repeat protein
MFGRKAVLVVEFSPDGRLLATLSEDHTALVFDAHSGQELHTFTHSGEVVFSPDGRLLVTAGADKTARIFDAHSGQELHTLAHDNGVTALAFSPDGRLLATGTYGNRAVLWALEPPSSG